MKNVVGVPMKKTYRLEMNDIIDTSLHKSGVKNPTAQCGAFSIPNGNELYSRLLTLERASGKAQILGFSLLEVLISMAVVFIIAVSVFTIQTSTWKKNTASNRMMIAGHLIERQVEKMRMDININPSLNWPPKSGSLTENGINLNWTISTATRPVVGGPPLGNVRRCFLWATWGTNIGDTLTVTTYLSKMF
jgi:type II secretory pathway pseudopilin PulG